MKHHINELIIIGSGPAGLTAGIYAVRANLKPLLVEGQNPGGQLMGTSIVENWPGTRSVLGPDLMMQMREHAYSAGVKFIEGSITSVDFSQSPFSITINKAEILYTKAAIIATGTIPNTLKCPGEDIYWGKGVTTCAVCDATFYSGKKVIIVGGGDSAMESASFLQKFTQHITIVHIGNTFTASHIMQQRIIGNSQIKIVYNSTVTEILGNGTKVTGATITNQETGQEHTIDTDGIFLAIGLKPNTKQFRGQINLLPNGYIETYQNSSKTSVYGVFAAGDAMDSRYRQAITAAGTGCMAALDAEFYLKEQESARNSP